MKTLTKKQIVCNQLGLDPSECSHGDQQYVREFESRFGELDEENFREHCDDVEFTEWAVEEGY